MQIKGGININILILPSWYPDKNNPINGVFFKEQVEGLNKLGINVTVLSINIESLSKLKSNKNKMGMQVSIENGVTVYRYYTYNFFPRMTDLYLHYYSKIIQKLIKKIENDKGKIELVHIHSAIDAGIAFSLSKSKIPYIITEHSTKYERDILNKTQIKYLSQVFQRANRVLVVGSGLKKSLSKYIDSSKFEILPNMVSIKKKDNIKIDNKKNKFRFFSLGILTRKKGMDLLIEVFKNNREELKQCELYIGGYGEEKENLEQLIKNYNLQENIKLLGKISRDEIGYYMSNSDCFILASRFETFGIVYLEAMVYGKPVIATQTGGPDDFINDENGILVPIEDVNSIGKAMLYMQKNIDKYNSMNIAKYCDERFSEKVVCNKIIDIYKEVINNNI